VSDALRLHLEATGSIDWERAIDLRPRPTHGSAPSAEGSVDAHLAYVDEVDRPRDSLGAERMLAALHLGRERARSGRTLGWPLLQELQTVVLGGPAPFRTTEAFAKAGRERYGWWPALAQEFADKLERDARGRAHPIARAARAYLDLCFFHPFEDGNARAARVAFDCCLTAAGLGLGHARLLFAPALVAGSREGYEAFLRTAVRCCQVARSRE
jgi:hypothetical protein